MPRKTERLVSLVSPDELARIQTAADRRGKSISAFLRIASLKLAAKVAKSNTEPAEAR